MPMYEDYREKYKQYFGMDFSNNYEVHHIDFNRENNAISNLVLLPRTLHREYHKALRKTPFWSVCHEQLDGDCIFPTKVTDCNNLDLWFDIDRITELYTVLKKCCMWYDYKLYLEGKIPNVHNIKMKE